MLTDEVASKLIEMPKKLIGIAKIDFPLPGEFIELDAKSTDERETFKFDVN